MLSRNEAGGVARLTATAAPPAIRAMNPTEPTTKLGSAPASRLGCVWFLVAEPVATVLARSPVNGGVHDVCAACSRVVACD